MLQGRLLCVRHPESNDSRCYVTMATVPPRRMLIVKIQKQLSDFSLSQLQAVASSIDDGQQTENVEDLSEPELYDMIVEYIRSDNLRAMEDEGMSQLLHLEDLLTDLLHNPDARAPTTDDSVSHQMEKSLTQQPEDTSPTTLLDRQSTATTTARDIVVQPPTAHGDLFTSFSTEDRDTHAPANDLTTSLPAKSILTGTGGVPKGRMSSSSTDQVVRLTDVAALLPRREFKLHGGQISDVGSDMSYSSLCKQIDEGLQEGFSEPEVMRTVLKITKPGTFRDMLTSKDDLTVDGLKRFLRSHIRDKNATELFQELSNARQQDRESPQQFLYRVMGLKQRVLFESQQPGAGFNYDRKLVQGTFLHTLYQGLNERNSHVRHDLKPFLSDTQVSDDFLLEQITKSTSEEEGRLKRLSTAAKSKPVTVSAAQNDSNEQTNQTKVDSELQANRQAINELTAQVSSLTKHLAQIVKPSESMTAASPKAPPTTRPQPPATPTRGRCNDCVQNGKVTCPHCFSCGQAGHRAIGCLQKKLSGNGKRSLERGSQ